MTLDKTKEHWKIIDDDFRQYLIERAHDKNLYVIWVWFHIQEQSYVVQFDYDNQIERDDVWDTIDEEDCMTLYNQEKAKLN